MKLTKYDKYKDAEMLWLDKVPFDWKVIRIKDIVRKIGSGVTPKGGSEIYVDSGITFLRSQNIYDDGLRIDDVSFITNEINEQMKSSQVKPKDILINITGASIGRSCVVPDTLKIANINQHMLYLRFKKSRVNYIAKYLKSNYIKEYIYSVQSGTSKEALNMRQALYFPLLVPSEKEQSLIVSFLINKTTAIDKKIELLETKNSYYKELSNSLINNAVCRGLQKNVPFKNSGIEWVGEIPKHWEVKRFKEVCYKNHTGGTPQTTIREYFEGDNIWVTIADIDDTKFVGNTSKLKLTKEAIRLTNIPISPKGSLLYSFKLTLGKIAFATQDIYTNEAIISILPNRKIDLRYCYYMLPIFLLLNASENIYGAKMLNQKQIGNALLTMPPVEEQAKIAVYLDNKTNTIDAILTNITKQIEELKELRKTLINDVVTGKLKVTE